MRKHVIPLTYAPKIQPVLSGRCTQTIRAGRKFKVGDLVSFHGWEGRPYHSKWSFRTPYWTVLSPAPIIIFQDGIETDPPFPDFIEEYKWNELDLIAAADFIDPPTGEELGRVLLAMHKIPDGGLPAQVIRWTFSNEV